MPLSTAAFPCYRDLFAPVEEYPQRIQRTPGDELCSLARHQQGISAVGRDGIIRGDRDLG